MAWRRMTTSVAVVVGDDGGDGDDGNALTWTEVENRCRRLGMSLATPEEL